MLSYLYSKKMNLWHSFLILSVFFFISACSSAPEKESNYYLLNNHQSIADVKFSAQNKATIASKASPANSTKQESIVIHVKELSEYLMQPYLVMQLKDHQLHYARLHMWAEPLLEGIKKALLFDLNNKAGHSQFILHEPQIIHTNLPKLQVQIEYFHASIDSKVTLSGRYWLEKSMISKSPSLLNREQEQRYPFYFEQQLTQNGYPHSVKKMRELINQLTIKISQTLF